MFPLGKISRESLTLPATGCAASPRGFRHSFGVGALQAALRRNLVQRWPGHATIRTTVIYADASGPEEQTFAGRLWAAL